MGPEIALGSFHTGNKEPQFLYFKMNRLYEQFNASEFLYFGIGCCVKYILDMSLFIVSVRLPKPNQGRSSGNGLGLVLCIPG